MDENARPPLYIFGWPSHVGGADTKLVHLLKLLHRHCLITVLPNHEERLHEREWTRFLDRLGIRATVIDRLPRKLQGCALSMSNSRFFKDRIAHKAKDRGLHVIWSSEMMWHHEGEAEAVENGLIDHVLYVSEFQRAALEPGYAGIPGTITGNYIDPEDYPFAERRNATFTIGRLSRPAWEKYPEDFPVFYECLGLSDTRFRVMAWSDDLARKYRWHRWTSSWELLAPNEEPTVAFLQSLDLFVYPLGHTFQESWGRAVVEAMLTGCVPLVPAGHHFENLIDHGRSGFLCGDFQDWREYAQKLRRDSGYRQMLSRECRSHAAEKLCNADEHRQVWLEMLRSVITQKEATALAS